MVSMQKIPRASCVLGSSSCSPADEGKTMEKGANSPKALECRAPSALQQPARVRGFPFLSPSQLLKELIPARAAAPGKSWMFSTGVLVGRRVVSLQGLGNVQRGTCCSHAAPYWARQHKEDGIRDWRPQNLPLGGSCPGPRGSLSIWKLLQGVRMGAGEVR